ncbi:hypothetical protein B0T26DRAFT_680973 [Lasiosphaeria miniovina]|uniref:Uncharacterized protein n=1 Tax=Lasiosphaeria miniovina TaxID=1954250 RepID=A0AA39ZTD9_9PEZI|nr:uncharacterized protein B0T26DRAFT_680973 [Lasiosphaeria miniovina]KAK0703273.1 hypothetical protein B0T26DRAFT_680973 [Lasiosphaeria miniovina]
MWAASLPVGWCNLDAEAQDEAFNEKQLLASRNDSELKSTAQDHETNSETENSAEISRSATRKQIIRTSEYDTLGDASPHFANHVPFPIGDSQANDSHLRDAPPVATTSSDSEYTDSQPAIDGKRKRLTSISATSGSFCYGEEGQVCEPPCLRCLALGKKCRSQAGGRASPCAQCHYAHRQSCRPSPPIMLKAK